MYRSRIYIQGLSVAVALALFARGEVCCVSSRSGVGDMVRTTYARVAGWESGMRLII